MPTLGVISYSTLIMAASLSTASYAPGPGPDYPDMGHKKFFPRSDNAAKQMAKGQYNEQLVVKKFAPMAAASYGKQDKVESCLTTVFPNGAAKVSLC
jgi:hypothetical protein